MVCGLDMGNKEAGMPEQNQRESLSTRLGFILLSAGCAIGLGNVWRFPYITGKYGGAVFVLVYLLFLVILGLPVMVMEFSIGRAGRSNIAGSLKVLEPEHGSWHRYGVVAVAGNYLLMMFYTVITGWLLYYFISSFTGSFSGMDNTATAAFFSSVQAQPTLQIGFAWMAILLGFMICGIGLQKGVEKVTKVMMILLLVIMLALAVNSIMIPGSSEGLRFYLLPDFSKVSEYGIGEVVFNAMSQAFFTLSIGMGGMAIFGSYIEKKQSLTGESVRVIALDTFVAIMSGLIIFPACFAYGVNPDSGPGLLFVTLPNIFNKMPLGGLWGSLFFLFMSFAAMTTLVAVFENIISYWMDERGWSRRKATWINCLAVMILCLPCVFGFNLLSEFTPLGPGTSVLDLEDFLISGTIMPLGSLILVLFCSCGKGWGWDGFLKEADEGEGLKFPAWSRIYVRWILPLIILIVFAKGYYDTFSKLI